jgi:hypothetical protein
VKDMEIVLNAENIMKIRTRFQDAKENQFGKQYSEIRNRNQEIFNGKLTAALSL